MKACDAVSVLLHSCPCHSASLFAVGGELKWEKAALSMRMTLAATFLSSFDMSLLDLVPYQETTGIHY